MVEDGDGLWFSHGSFWIIWNWNGFLFEELEIRKEGGAWSVRVRQSCLNLLLLRLKN